MPFDVDLRECHVLVKSGETQRLPSLSQLIAVPPSSTHMVRLDEGEVDNHKPYSPLLPQYEVVVLGMMQVQQAELEVQYDPVTNLSLGLLMRSVLRRTFRSAPMTRIQAPDRPGKSPHTKMRAPVRQSSRTRHKSVA